MLARQCGGLQLKQYTGHCRSLPRGKVASEWHSFKQKLQTKAVTPVKTTADALSQHRQLSLCITDTELCCQSASGIAMSMMHTHLQQTTSCRSYSSTSASGKVSGMTVLAAGADVHGAIYQVEVSHTIPACMHHALGFTTKPHTLALSSEPCHAHHSTPCQLAKAIMPTLGMQATSLDTHLMILNLHLPLPNLAWWLHDLGLFPAVHQGCSCAGLYPSTAAHSPRPALDLTQIISSMHCILHLEQFTTNHSMPSVHLLLAVQPVTGHVVASRPCGWKKKQELVFNM